MAISPSRFFSREFRSFATRSLRLADRFADVDSHLDRNLPFGAPNERDIFLIFCDITHYDPFDNTFNNNISGEQALFVILSITVNIFLFQCYLFRSLIDRIFFLLFLFFIYNVEIDSSKAIISIP